MQRKSTSLEELLASLRKEITSLLHEYREKDEDIKEKIEISLLTLLRFSPIDDVTNFVMNEISNDKLIEIYRQVNTTFSGAYFSRYSDPKDLTNLMKFYYPQSEYKDDTEITVEHLKKISQVDSAYGARRQKLTEDLKQNLKPTSQMSFAPKECSVFHTLPASSKGTRRAAALMEQVSTWSRDYQRENKNKDSELFGMLRKVEIESGFWTPMVKRYAWGQQLVQAVMHHSQSMDIKIDRLDKKYSLTYPTESGDIVVNNTEALGSMPIWYHGRAPLTSTWRSVEDSFEKVLAMDFKETSKKEFYSAVAELVWLVGNSQPMLRGSGSIAEIMLAVVHIHHGLQPPVLKLEFPQLDVLDISFPLDDYKYIFPYLFERITLPPDLKLSPIKPGQSVSDELKAIYEIKNNDPEVKCIKINRLVIRELDKELYRLKKKLNPENQERYNLLNELKNTLAKIPVNASEKDCVRNYIKNCDAAIKKCLDDPKLEKYSRLQKSGIRLANLGMFLTFPLSMPTKWFKTGSVLFSKKGKSKTAVRNAHHILKKHSH